MFSELRRVVVVGVSALALVACEGTLAPQEDTPVEDRAAATGQQQGADSSQSGARALPSQRGWQGHPLDNPDSILATRTVYFEFDSAEIRPEDRAIIEAHAAYMAESPNAMVTLEGHADERGTREYNIGLGDRRSQAVRRVLSLLGVSDNQVELVSYGEERPATMGHDESAWSQNRRVEFNYTAR